ncbi:MAG: tetratricopeptide repeat protein [bacterium]|nr:tetratricopeptide repeat protein [bacterium]
MSRFVCAGLLLLGVMAGTVFADPHAAFDEGLRLYRESDMDRAAAAWERAIAQGVVSGPLLYNLGNAYYRQGNIGRAILYYERARALLPRDGDVKTNLDLARLAVVDRIEKPVRLPVWDWLDAVRDALSLPELSRLFQAEGFLAAICLAITLLGVRWLKRVARTVAVVMLVLFALTGAWYVWRAALDSREFAIIIVDKTEAKSAPDEASKELFALHMGTKVQCIEQLGNWLNVRIADDRKGWIAIGDAETI